MFSLFPFCFKGHGVCAYNLLCYVMEDAYLAVMIEKDGYMRHESMEAAGCKLY